MRLKLGADNMKVGKDAQLGYVVMKRFEDFAHTLVPLLDTALSGHIKALIEDAQKALDTLIDKIADEQMQKMERQTKSSGTTYQTSYSAAFQPPPVPAAPPSYTALSATLGSTGSGGVAGYPSFGVPSGSTAAPSYPSFDLGPAPAPFSATLPKYKA